VVFRNVALVRYAEFHNTLPENTRLLEKWLKKVKVLHVFTHSLSGQGMPWPWFSIAQWDQTGCWMSYWMVSPPFRIGKNDPVKYSLLGVACFLSWLLVFSWDVELASDLEMR
jgi:hypothetical protein